MKKFLPIAISLAVLFATTGCSPRSYIESRYNTAYNTPYLNQALREQLNFMRLVPALKQIEAQKLGFEQDKIELRNYLSSSWFAGSSPQIKKMLMDETKRLSNELDGKISTKNKEITAILPKGWQLDSITPDGRELNRVCYIFQKKWNETTIPQSNYVYQDGNSIIFLFQKSDKYDMGDTVVKYTDGDNNMELTDADEISVIDPTSEFETFFSHGPDAQLAADKIIRTELQPQLDNTKLQSGL